MNRGGEILLRTATGLLGGWAFTWGFVTLGIVALVAAGVGYEDAQTGVYLLAFLLYLTLFCWSFGTRRPVRAFTTIALGAAVLSGAAWWWSSALAV
ncbi:MAG: iron uptake protein [Steroidobacteraceae bacterium]